MDKGQGDGQGQAQGYDSPAYDTQRKAFSKELERYSLEQLPNESSLKCFMETKQDQQLFLLGKYIVKLFKLTLSLDAK